MKRRYTMEDYQNLIFKAKKIIPWLSVGVDVIVGFPGETEEDFIMTHDFLRDIPVSYLHVFTYSERPDTEALKMPFSVDPAERKRRNKILRILSDKKRRLFYSGMIGTVQEVLFEDNNQNGDMLGFTSNYIRVKADFDPLATNKLTKFKLTGIEDNKCTGEILSEKMQLT
jgi:threonylcarbamoyladenosine tRNA methylthiotransferase MtaB